ncbi:MAG: baseplate J/gp47 family protein [Leptospiraceae bacterium]|nr:baseplate J/gp47 family protein [Leptospiraceae bacterium]
MSVYQTKNDTQTAILQSVNESGVFKRYLVNPLSRIYTLIRALANAQHTFINESIIRLQQAIHPHTAIHPHDLELWKRRFLLDDRSATLARHNIRIGSTEVPASNITIPQGLIIRTEDGVKFRILSSGVLATSVEVDGQGYYTIPLVAEALTAGTDGNVVQNSITVIESAPTGIDVVYNPDSEVAFPARDAETLPELRSRFLAAEAGASSQMWSPAWYLAQAIAIEEIYRAFYDSALVTGQPGLSRLWVTGKTGDLLPQVLSDLYDDLNVNPEKYSGTGIVQVFPLVRHNINRTVTVTFSEAGYIPEQEELDAMAEEFFLDMERGEDFSNSALESRFYTLGGVTNVESTPDENVTVPDGEIAIIGASFTVTGEVAT